MAMVFIKAVLLVLVKVELVMLMIRAIISPIGQGFIYSKLVMMTDPVIYPIRLICSKFVKDSAMRIDFSFLVTYLLFILLELLLRAL